MAPFFSSLDQKMFNAVEKLKNWYKSTVIWFNAILVGALPMLDYAQTQLPTLKGYLPDHLYTYAFVATVVGNIFLRFRTTKALEDK